MSDSIWKKEIGFGRKPKQPKTAPAAAAPPAASSAPTPTAPRQSIWKKEIGGRRKPKLPAAPVVPEAPAAAGEQTPIERAWSYPSEAAWPERKERWWNKEIGGSKKSKAEPQPAAGAAPQVPSPVPEATLVGESHGQFWSAGPELPPAPVDEVVPVVPVAVPPETPAAAPAPEIVSEAPVPAPEPVSDASGAATRTAETPPAPRQSVWKKEIGLGRKPKAAAVPAPEPAAAGAAPAAPKQSLWKKEISLGRKSKPAAEAAPTAGQAPNAGPEPKSKRKQKQNRSRRSLRLSGPSLSSGRGSARLVGLKVGGSQLAAARVHNNGAAELVQVARMPLESGVVVGGELRDPQALAAALRAFFTQNKLPRRGVRLGVASSRIGVRIFEISGIEDERQFVNAVRFRAQEALPIALDEAVLDYRTLDERQDENGELVRRVLLVVAHRDLVERYVEACHLAGLQLVGIDLEAFALLRALAPPADREGSALVAVAIGHERTTLAVSDGRVCEFTRVLEWGGWALNVAVARVLDAAPADVENVKRNLSLLGGPPPAGLSPEQANSAVEAVRRGIEALARELVSSLQFYQAQPGSLGIGEVVLTGGTAHLPGLAEELQRLLGVTVRVGDPLRRLKVASSVAETDIGSLAIAIGLGIED